MKILFWIIGAIVLIALVYFGYKYYKKVQEQKDLERRLAIANYRANPGVTPVIITNKDNLVAF